MWSRPRRLAFLSMFLLCGLNSPRPRRLHALNREMNASLLDGAERSESTSTRNTSALDRARGSGKRVQRELSISNFAAEAQRPLAIGVPAAEVISAAGKKRHGQHRLFADDVLEMLSGASFTTLFDLLPMCDTPAIRSIDEKVAPLTHARLRQFIADEFDLAQYGIGRGDRVALLMPNGPELALAFVAVLTYASCAPLNPASTTAELSADLKSSQAKLVLVAKPDAGLVSVAAELGVPLVEATPMTGSNIAGLFTLSLRPATGVRTAPIPPKAPSQREDEAFVLHTSGSTGNKKLVPHLLEDLVVGAVCIAAACRLEASDVCCNQMPLYHIAASHGMY